MKTLHSTYAAPPGDVTYSLLKLIKAVPFLLILLLAVSCGDDDEPETDNPNLIDSSGGLVTAAGGDVQINIPPGALSTATEITVVSTTSHPTGNVGTVYDLGPDGTTFSSPVQLTFTYEDGDIPSGVAESNLVLAWDDGGTWNELLSTVDATNNTVTAETNHFTPFAIVQQAQNVEAPTTLSYSPSEYDFIPEQPFSTSEPQSNGTGLKTYSIASITPEAAIENFSINSTSGVISAAGTSIFSTGADQVFIDIQVANAEGEFVQQNALTINLLYPPAFLTYNPSSITTTLSQTFETTVSSIQGTAPFTYSLLDLPSGLGSSTVIINAETGAISGTVAADATPGEYQIGVKIENAAGINSDNDVLTLIIEAGGEVQFPESITYNIPDNPVDGSPANGIWSVIKNETSTITLANPPQGFTYVLQNFFPTPEGDLTVDSQTGAITYSPNIKTQNTASFVNIDITLEKDGQSKIYEDVVVLFEQELFGYVWQYEPREYTVNTSGVTTSSPTITDQPEVSSPIYSIEFIENKNTGNADFLINEGIVSINTISGVVSFNDPAGDFQFADYNVSLRVTNEVDGNFSILQGAILFKKP